MEIARAITILKEHNRWRRSLPPYDNFGEDMPYSAIEIGQALDAVIDFYSDYEKIALSWADCKRITEIADEYIQYVEPMTTQADFYSQVLKRFNEERHGQ